MTASPTFAPNDGVLTSSVFSFGGDSVLRAAPNARTFDSKPSSQRGSSGPGSYNLCSAQAHADSVAEFSTQAPVRVDREGKHRRAACWPDVLDRVLLAEHLLQLTPDVCDVVQPAVDGEDSRLVRWKPVRRQPMPRLPGGRVVGTQVEHPARPVRLSPRRRWHRLRAEHLDCAPEPDDVRRPLVILHKSPRREPPRSRADPKYRVHDAG